jgi:hypothetical protein
MKTKFCVHCNGKVRHSNTCVGKELSSAKARIKILEIQVDYLIKGLRYCEQTLNPIDWI